jgi:hypothetical protein
LFFASKKYVKMVREQQNAKANTQQTFRLNARVQTSLASWLNQFFGGSSSAGSRFRPLFLSEF